MSAEERRRNKRIEATREQLLREGLLVLIHHNIVIAVPIKKGSASMLYEIDIDAIIRRLCFPKYSEHVRSRYAGEEAIDSELIIDEMLKQGRATKLQAIDHALSEAKKLGGARRHGGEEIQKHLEHTWERLVAERYLIVSDISAWAPDKALAGSRKRATSSASPRGGPSEKRQKIAPGNAKSVEHVECDGRLAQLWTVNTHLIMCELRHSVCTNLVATKCGADYGELVQTMLGLTKHEEKTSKDAKSPTISIQRLYDSLPEKIDWSVMCRGVVWPRADHFVGCRSQEELEERLEYLYRDPLEMVSRSNAGTNPVCRAFLHTPQHCQFTPNATCKSRRCRRRACAHTVALVAEARCSFADIVILVLIGMGCEP